MICDVYVYISDVSSDTEMFPSLDIVKLVSLTTDSAPGHYICIVPTLETPLSPLSASSVSQQ